MMAKKNLIPESELLSKHLAIARADKPLGHFRSLPRTDRLLGGIRRGRVNTICGSPGVSKTTLMNQLCDDAAAQGFACVFASMEIAPSQILAKSLARMSNGTLTISDIPNDAKSKQVDEVAGRYAETIAPNLYYIDGPASPVELAVAVAQAEQETERNVLLFVDYLQITPVEGDVTGIDERTAINQAMGGLRRIANKHAASVFVISSINRTNYAKEKAGLDALGGSSTIEYASDTVIHLAVEGTGEERAENMNKAIRPIVLTCAKNRYSRTGTVKLSLDCAHALFWERADDEE